MSEKETPDTKPKKIRKKRKPWKWLKRNIGRILAVLTIAALIVFFVTYKEEKKSTTVPFDYNPETTPTMVTDDVRTVISDSGYIRYMIQSPIWYVYNEAKRPNWRFPEGLYLERYNDTMGVNAVFRCDTAIYLTDEKLWQFAGNVRMVNDLGDKFATQKLFWNQQEHKLSSDSFMHIEKNDRIIEGYGFESDENIKEYRVHKPSMILPISDFNRVPGAAAPGATPGGAAAAYPPYSPSQRHTVDDSRIGNTNLVKQGDSLSNKERRTLRQPIREMPTVQQAN